MWLYLRATSVFRVKFDVEFGRQAVNFSIGSYVSDVVQDHVIPKRVTCGLLHFPGFYILGVFFKYFYLCTLFVFVFLLFVCFILNHFCSARSVYQPT